MATSTDKKIVSSIPSYDFGGEKSDAVVAPKSIFSTLVSPSLLAQYMRVYLTNQRQGNASTKTRAEVAGTTKKMYKQKGTGKARHGSYRAPIFKGGGVVGGPKPKIFHLSMNKKQKIKGLFGALSLKKEQNGILNLGFGENKKEMKTKDVFAWLKKMELIGKKTLFVLPEERTSKYIPFIRNIKNISYTSAHSLNAYSVMLAEKIVFVDQALKELESHFLKKHEN